jgi:glycerophosphoryl diester phosphodiesterase
LYLVGRYKPDFSTVLSEMQRLRVDGLDSKAQGLIDAKFVGQLKDAGFPLYVWTVNDEELAQKFISLGVEGITTDRPSWLLKYLQDKYPDG